LGHARWRRDSPQQPSPDGSQHLAPGSPWPTPSARDIGASSYDEITIVNDRSYLIVPRRQEKSFKCDGWTVGPLSFLDLSHPRPALPSDRHIHPIHAGAKIKRPLIVIDLRDKPPAVRRDLTHQLHSRRRHRRPRLNVEGDGDQAPLVQPMFISPLSGSAGRASSAAPAHDEGPSPISRAGPVRPLRDRCPLAGGRGS